MIDFGILSPDTHLAPVSTPDRKQNQKNNIPFFHWDAIFVVHPTGVEPAAFRVGV